jgi:hypothetical protein
MNLELSTKMQENGFLVDWAEAVQYNLNMTDDFKDTSEALDGWARKIGEKGVDKDNEIAELVRRAITNDVVAAPDELISMMFDESSIGEFDDVYGIVEPKNTIKVFESIKGGNVDASYIDFTRAQPEWKELQAETFIKYVDLRRGGFKTVANLITFMKEAFAQKRWSVLFNRAVAAVTAAPNLISESTAAPTATSADALALYLMDITEPGENTVILGQNKYIMAMSKLPSAANIQSNEAKEAWRRYGTIGYYAGQEMRGFSGVRKMADGNLVIPNQVVLGVAGKIGSAITRGETLVYETMDNNAERVHIKANGFSFGTMITKPEKIAKIVMAQ